MNQLPTLGPVYYQFIIVTDWYLGTDIQNIITMVSDERMVIEVCVQVI